MYVLKQGKQYVAIDSHSGGYPYLVDSFHLAKIWIDFGVLERYWRMFPKYDVYEIEVKETFIAHWEKE